MSDTRRRRRRRRRRSLRDRMMIAAEKEARLEQRNAKGRCMRSICKMYVQHVGEAEETWRFARGRTRRFGRQR
eukprot:760944-Hanusia_phi.AAC.2